MKKYEKPAIEIVEANLSAEYMLTAGDSQGAGEYSVGPSDAAPGRKESIDDDDFAEGW